MKPLLGLVMLVKNEARGIVETLAGIAPFIDRWTVLDTGSTDGTQELIRQHAGSDGLLFEEPFVDFATSRNRVLDLHGDATQFTIMLSGDDILIGGEALLLFLLEQREAPTEIYNVERQLGSSRFMTAIVQRTGTDWRYTGRTHEVITKAGCFATEQIPGVRIIRRHDGTPEDKRTRWQQDLALLIEDAQLDPTNARTAFYLAQTYECLGMLNNAFRKYEQRIELGGWAEEVYEAKFRQARILDDTKRSWSETERAYLEAHLFDPRRAEPLYRIALHYHQHGEHALTYLFACRAMELPRPNAMLFVDAEIYEWKAADLVAISAYYLGKQLGDDSVLAMGERAAERAVGVHPEDARLIANLAFYR